MFFWQPPVRCPEPAQRPLAVLREYAKSFPTAREALTTTPAGMKLNEDSEIPDHAIEAAAAAIEKVGPDSPRSKPSSDRPGSFHVR